VTLGKTASLNQHLDLTNLHISFKRAAPSYLALLLALSGSCSILSYAQCSTSYLRSNADPKTYISIPFTVIHGVPVAKLTVNESSQEFFIIDSGSSKSVLDFDAAKRLGIKVSRKPINIAISGTADSDSLPLWGTNKVKIGYSHQSIVHGTLPIVRLGTINHLATTPITGVIGYDVIRAHPFALDYLRGILTIFSGNIVEPSATSIKIQLEHRNDTPIITTSFTISDELPLMGRILIDTGSQFGLEISRQFGKKNDLYALHGWVETSGLGIGGSHVSLHGINGAMLLGDEKVQLMDIRLSEAEKGQTATDSFDAILGNAILGRFVVIFDVPHGQIFFDPIC
jgi:hypothetical protein